MTQADSVHSTPPTNTSVETPLGDSGKPQDSLFLPTDISPEEAFQAIGRLRKEARDEIDRLLQFLDETDNHMEREPDGLEDEDSDPGEDGADNEPSLGSHGHGDAGAIMYLVHAISDGCEMVYDCEGDEHDGREPDGGDDEPSAGFDAGEPSLGWTVDGCMTGGTGMGRSEVEDDLEAGEGPRADIGLLNGVA